MSILYLTPSSISDLTLFIFIALVAGYLWVLARKSWRRAQKPLPTIFLAGAFTSVASYVLLTFLEQALYPDLGFYALPLQSVAMTFALVWLVQFAYHFPVLPPDRRRESYAALWLTLLLPLWEGGYAVYRYSRLAQGIVKYRPSEVDYVVAAVFLWFLVVLLRQVGRSDERQVPLWRKLWRPHGRPARTTRAFASLSVSPLWLMTVIILRTEGYLPDSITVVLLSLGILFTLLAFVLVYLNTLPEATSFMVKLVAISLALILGILGTVGQMISPAFIAGYRNPHLIADHQTLRFTPNTQGGYDVTVAPFHFDSDFGTDLGYGYVRMELPYDFPFFDQVWREAYIYDEGVISFVPPAGDWLDTIYRYGSLPAIFALHLDLVIDPDELLRDGGFFARNTADRLIITWYQLPETRAPETRYTFQLVLYPDGVFEITYNGLPAIQNYDIYDALHTARVIGALLGSSTLVPQYIRFNTDLPFAGGGAGGIVEDYHRDFRRALHQLLAPLVTLILGSTVLVAGGLPFVFRHNLVRPLKNLLAGMREVDAGNLGVTIPVQFNDEFGSLTRSFNNMTRELRTLVTDLEGRVAARTAELAESQRKTAAAHTRLQTILNNLDTLIYVSDVETYEILFANRQIQETFGPVAGRLCWQVLQAGQSGPCEFCSNPKLLTASGTPTGIHHWEFQNTRNGRWYALADSAIEWMDGRLVHLSMAVDITDIKKSESRLLTQQRALATLEERERIGRELHDSLGQVLGYLNVQAQAAQALFADGKVEAGDRTLARLAGVAQDAHSDVREFILGMKGTPGVAQNFWDALRAYAATFESHYQVRVLLSLPGGRESLLSPEGELHLLRIIQEALTNVRKHAGASQVQIIFSLVDAHTQVVIADDGRGFEPPPLSPPQAGGMKGGGHHGLNIMRERAGEIGGRLEVRSRPGEGTQVILTFPLWEQPAEGEKPPPGAGAALLRVLLVDDHPMFLEGLRDLLSSYGLRVVGLAQDGLQAQELARTTHPDVIVMDVNMPRCDGIEATRRIKREFPEIEIVMLTVSTEDETLFEALKAGASGYLLKSMKAEDFFLLISGLEAGTPPIAPQLAGKVLAEFQKLSLPEAELSDRQWQVLRLVAQGFTYVQIAQRLYVSERTVKRYVKEILARLHLKSRAEAEAYARRRGL